MSVQDTKELDSCSHCLVGNVILKTEILALPVGMARFGSSNPTTTVVSCYCDTCATLFHAPTYLAKLEKKKSPR